MFYTLGLQSQDASLLPHHQRYIPTFVHQDIFGQQVASPNPIGKYTPTFHSTALQTQGYNIPTHHQKSNKKLVNRPQSAHKVQYMNQSRLRRVQDLDTYKRTLYNSPKKDFWYDHTKQDFLKMKWQGLKNYSKQRKYKELCSDLVFTDYVYGSQAQNVQLHQNNCHQPQVTNETNLSQPLNQVIDRIEVNQPVQHERTPEIINQPVKIQQTTKKVKQPSKRAQTDKNLKLKGKKIQRKVPLKPKIVSQRPTFTVIRQKKIPII